MIFPNYKGIVTTEMIIPEVCIVPDFIVLYTIYLSLNLTTSMLPEAPNNRHRRKALTQKMGNTNYITLTPAQPSLRPEDFSLLYSALGLKPRGIHSPQGIPRVPFSPQWAQPGHCLWCNFSLDSYHAGVSAQLRNPPPGTS